jgi:putative metal binding uncharacterized protein
VHEALARANFERDVAMLDEKTARRLRWIVHDRSYPNLDVTIQHSTSLRLRLLANDWDDLPPSITILNPDGSPCTLRMPGGLFHQGPHNITGRPFICSPGSREYHTHTSHTNDLWCNHRGQDGMNLVGILMQIASAWRKAVR